MSEPLDYVLDLLDRMPPQKIDHVLQSVLDIIPHLCQPILSSIDQPLKIVRDVKAGRDYLLSDYNRDADSHRSPWTNTYYPPLEDGILPSEQLRMMEIETNAAFDQYREMYFEGGISSVYFWEVDQGFAVAILIKNSGNSNETNGCWDSIHVIEVLERAAAKTAQYKLTSTVMIWLSTSANGSGSSTLAGRISRMAEKTCGLGESGMSIVSSHIAAMGRMVEDMENHIRSNLHQVYVGTSKNIIDSLRSFISTSEERKRRQLAQDVNQALQHMSPM